MLPIRHQTIPEPILIFGQVDRYEKISKKFVSKDVSKQYIWKYHLQNIIRFIEAISF